MWVVQEWEDYSLSWNPVEYGGVTSLYVPSESIWLPDIVLYNNADGDYTVTIRTKANITHTGKVIWTPPAIYKSQCYIKVDMRHIWTERLHKGELEAVETGIDLKQYYRNVEWDIMGVPARKNVKYYPCCKEPYPDITFNITIRRKPLSYGINLIIPCVSVMLLTITTFYLPADSGEKMSLSVTILVSLSIFQLAVMELLPPTSLTIPLLGKYIFFTTIMVSATVCNSVFSLNFNNRTKPTHEMSKFTRFLFLNALPKLLLMTLKDNSHDKVKQQKKNRRKRQRMQRGKPQNYDVTDEELTEWTRQTVTYYESPYNRHLTPGVSGMNYEGYSREPTPPWGGDYHRLDTSRIDTSNFCTACTRRRAPVTVETPQVQKALEGVQYLADHTREQDDFQKVVSDYKFVSSVIDRLCLWIYSAVCIVGSGVMLLNAPQLYDPKKPIVYADD